ncbi:hypothetical protein [Paraburkholderia silvatlantica]|uniref:hypothetical protein n=1 Tax=Paraburkholderia silvatlantica TaxID=321895 RepID=UPI0010E5888A|nr:hypothetical protein [Paraburkholderia silvatlantica]TDQ73617.1 hypothetical protein C7412_14627 [Paraburkholderia silvatlantica]
MFGATHERTRNAAPARRDHDRAASAVEIGINAKILFNAGDTTLLPESPGVLARITEALRAAPTAISSRFQIFLPAVSKCMVPPVTTVHAYYRLVGNERIQWLRSDEWEVRCGSGV